MKLRVGGLSCLGFAILLLLLFLSRPHSHNRFQPRERTTQGPLDPASIEAQRSASVAMNSIRSRAVLAERVGSFETTLNGLDDLLSAVIELHHGLVSKASRKDTLAALEAAWPSMTAPGQVLTAFLVGGHSDADIAKFRQAMLGSGDPRVLVFVGRSYLMDAIDESTPQVSDEEERLRIRLGGLAVQGFNAKDYRVFWECSLFEIITKMGRSLNLTDDDFVKNFRSKYAPSGHTGLSPELALYNDCFGTRLESTTARAPLQASIVNLEPCEAKTAIFKMLLYRPDGKAPADMIELCGKIAVNMSEDNLDRYRSVQALARYGRQAEVLRTVLALELTQLRPDLSLGREAINGLLKAQPNELSENPTSYNLALQLVTKVATSDRPGELEWIVPLLMDTKNPALQNDLEKMAQAVATASPAGSQVLASILNEYKPK